MPTEKPRYTVIVDEELLKRIDDFRFENRYPSRSAATLDLIRLGLEDNQKRQKRAKKYSKREKAPPEKLLIFRGCFADFQERRRADVER